MCSAAKAGMAAVTTFQASVRSRSARVQRRRGTLETRMTFDPSPSQRGDPMKQTLTALAAAGTLALATVATPTTSDARWWGPAIGAFAAGAIIGGALASPYAYGYYGGYYPGYSNYPYGYYPAYSYGPAY